MSNFCAVAALIAAFLFGFAVTGLALKRWTKL